MASSQKLREDMATVLGNLVSDNEELIVVGTRRVMVVVGFDRGVEVDDGS